MGKVGATERFAVMMGRCNHGTTLIVIKLQLHNQSPVQLLPSPKPIHPPTTHPLAPVATTMVLVTHLTVRSVKVKMVTDGAMDCTVRMMVRSSHGMTGIVAQVQPQKPLPTFLPLLLPH